MDGWDICDEVVGQLCTTGAGERMEKEKKSSPSASVCVVNFMEDLENEEAEERFML